MNYTTFKISKTLDIPRPTLQAWLERHLIEPSVQEAEGPGTKNLFDLEDVYKIALFQLLSVAGFTQREASKRSLITSFKDVKEDGERYLVISKYRGERFVLGEAEITETIPTKLPRKHQLLIVVDLYQIKKEVDAKLLK